MLFDLYSRYNRKPPLASFISLRFQKLSYDVRLVIPGRCFNLFATRGDCHTVGKGLRLATHLFWCTSCGVLFKDVFFSMYIVRATTATVKNTKKSFPGWKNARKHNDAPTHHPSARVQ